MHTLFTKFACIPNTLLSRSTNVGLLLCTFPFREVFAQGVQENILHNRSMRRNVHDIGNNWSTSTNLIANSLIIDRVIHCRSGVWNFASTPRQFHRSWGDFHPDSCWKVVIDGIAHNKVMPYISRSRLNKRRTGTAMKSIRLKNIEST